MFYTTTSSNIISQQVEAEEREMSVESPIQSKIIRKTLQGKPPRPMTFRCV